MTAQMIISAFASGVPFKSKAMTGAQLAQLLLELSTTRKAKG